MTKRAKKLKAAKPVQVTTMRRSAWEEKVEAMGEGRRERAQTFPDRRKVGNKKACRGRIAW